MVESFFNKFRTLTRLDIITILAIIAVILVIVFDFTNGFHDASNILATAIASRAMTPTQAVITVAFFEFIGPLLGGTAVANTIGSFVQISDLQSINAVLIILAGLVGVIVWNLGTWWFGLPSSSSHALMGGLVGVTWVAVGGNHVVWGFKDFVETGHIHGVTKVLIALVISPILGFAIGFLIQKTAHLLLRGATDKVNKPL